MNLTVILFFLFSLTGFLVHGADMQRAAEIEGEKLGKIIIEAALCNMQHPDDRAAYRDCVRLIDAPPGTISELEGLSRADFEDTRRLELIIEKLAADATERVEEEFRGRGYSRANSGGSAGLAMVVFVIVGGVVGLTAFLVIKNKSKSTPTCPARPQLNHQMGRPLPFSSARYPPQYPPQHPPQHPPQYPPQYPQYPPQYSAMSSAPRAPV